MKIKTDLAQAAQAAVKLVTQLRPYCERIEVAGSIRRQRPHVGDIEIVAIPRHHVNLFGEPTGQTQIDDWIAGLPEKASKNGNRMKQFQWGGYQVDLFIATPENFGWILLLRTGSAAFSRRMVTGKPWGFKPANITLGDGRIIVDGRVVPVPEEEDVWRLWEKAPVSPQDREWPA